MRRSRAAIPRSLTGEEVLRGAGLRVADGWSVLIEAANRRGDAGIRALKGERRLESALREWEMVPARLWIRQTRDRRF